MVCMPTTQILRFPSATHWKGSGAIPDLPVHVIKWWNRDTDSGSGIFQRREIILCIPAMTKKMVQRSITEACVDNLLMKDQLLTNVFVQRVNNRGESFIRRLLGHEGTVSGPYMFVCLHSGIWVGDNMVDAVQGCYAELSPAIYHHRL